MGDDVTEAAEKAAEAAPVDVTPEEMEEVGDWIADLIRAAEGIVVLPPERWDHVIHSLEENIDQLHGPTEVVETDDGYEVRDLMDVSDELDEEIKALEETLLLIMEQVTEDGGS